MAKATSPIQDKEGRTTQPHSLTECRQVGDSITGNSETGAYVQLLILTPDNINDTSDLQHSSLVDNG